MNPPPPPSSSANDAANSSNPLPTAGARSTSSRSSAWTGSSSRQTPRRGLPPIATASSGHTRPSSSGESPSRAAFSPTSLAFGSLSGAGRQLSSRQSSTSSNTSLVSPSAAGQTAGPLHSGSRSRAVTSAGSPRLSSSLASPSSASQPTRLVRHSPSHSLSTTSSPASSATAAQGAGQLTGILLAQLKILFSALKESNFDSQADKIRSFVDDNGMDVYTSYFRRLLQSNAPAIFPHSARPPAATDSAAQYKLLAEEMAKVSRDPQQAEKIAQSLDTNESELFQDFDLSTFIDHFRLNHIAKVALVLPIRLASKPDLRSKADAILTSSFQNFLHTLSSSQPPNADAQDDVHPAVLAALIERLIQEPPRNWGEEQRENFNYAIRVRYSRPGSRIPPSIESALFLMDLLDLPDSRLARLVQRSGPRSTASLDACKEMLAGVETRDISYLQIANALLFMVNAQDAEPYDSSVFVEGLRHHRAGPKIDWTDVVQGFDKETLRVTKQQFLALYNALLPLAKEYVNFDIQLLWGGNWNNAETQLSFVVAFLSTTAQELDVTQIPDLRQAFTLEDFEEASESVKAFAVEAVKHPLVSRDATEVLFTIIFRSQETYNMAQTLGIPDTIINPNMTIFVCAASAVPKPWAALQEQALKQLFYPFLLKQHDNYDFVMFSLWLHDKHWVATRLVEFYQQEQMLLSFIFEHAFEQGWLELLLTIQNSFVVDLATYAHGKNALELADWATPHISTMGPQGFAKAIVEFVGSKVEDEVAVQKEHKSPTTVRLAVKTVHLLLFYIGDALTDEDTGPIFKQCLVSYPRLFNYGEDDKRDAILDSRGEQSNMLPEETAAKMDDYFKDLYGGNINPEQLITELKQLKVSEDPTEQDLFAATLLGLFEEYSCYGQYPNEALATTAVLFGGLIQFHVLPPIPEQAAIHMIFEAVSESGLDDPMYRFGLQAMIHLLGRLKEWPHLAERILRIPSLRNTQAITAAENALKELQQENGGLNGDSVNGITNGAVDEEFGIQEPTPPFASVQIDPPLRPELYEDPNEEVSDKVMFVLNNVSKRNLEEKFRDLESALEDKHHQWFARYLVEELAKTQINFQGLYLQILENFDKKILWQEVLRETYVSCAKMLNAESTVTSPSERTNLKNLANWLGSLTLARNQPILHRNISFKDLLIEGNDTQRLIVAIPFTCKALLHAGKSKTFKPPNPWLMELLGVLSELYHFFELRLNLKFEIEVLCKDLNTEIKEIPPLEVLRSRPLLHESNMLQPYMPEGPDGFGEMALMSKRAANDRFSPEAVIQALPDLSNMLQIPQAAGNVTQPQLRSIFINAAQQAIYEIIAPVVERSVTIAAISTAELVQKDFATEADVEKVRSSAHTVVKALSGSLALVTCKEPLRMSIMNNIRILATRTLQEPLPEGQIIMFVNDNIDTVCGLVERAAEEHSLAEIDAQLSQAIEDRRRHAAERPNEPYSNPPLSRWAQMIPEPYRQDSNGLNRQQLNLYEEFGRQMRINTSQHANNQSQDSIRPLPDVLGDTYLPSLPTPAEAPAMPRPTPQQRMLAMQGQQNQSQVNGYMESPNAMGRRVLELMQELQSAAREAPEEHIGDISEGAPIRGIYEELIATVNAPAGAIKDNIAIGAGTQCFYAIFKDPQKRLEIEVFVRLLKQLCSMSASAGRHLTMQLATMGDDSIYSPGVIVAMVQEELYDMQYVDGLVSKGLKDRRTAALNSLKDLVAEFLLGDNPVALRSDFALTYQALIQWNAEEPSLELGREILSNLQVPLKQVNGMPSPPHEGKKDQLEYIFEEWNGLQRKDTPQTMHLAFVKQMHDKHIISEPEDVIRFLRACIEMSCSYFERLTAAPYPGKDAPYTQIDALAKLIAYLAVFQSPVVGETQGNTAKSLEAMVRVVILVMNDHHNRLRERWPGRVYFRLFSSLFSELHDMRAVIGAEQELAISKVLARAVQVMQPRYFPGFTHAWFALLSHHLIIPAFLAGSGRTNGGWDTYIGLLNIMFINLGILVEFHDGPVTQQFYHGVLSFLMMLHHDFPEFLVNHQLELTSTIPPFCFQMHNIVNSAVTRAVMNEQPDPFSTGLKINRFEQSRQQPPIRASLDNLLADAGLKEAMERVCGGAELASDELQIILTKLEGESTQSCRLITNTIVQYIGVHATATSSAFSAAATPARLLERILRDTSKAEVRYHLVVGMVNQLRYINAHTHYFMVALQHFFKASGEQVQQIILRIVCERLGVSRPHPWGLIVMMLELNKLADGFIQKPWMQAAPQVQSMMLNLGLGEERRRNTLATSS